MRNLASFEQGLAGSGPEKPALVIVDIGIQGVDWEGAIRRACELGYPVLAFGPHMDLEGHARARQAGARRVVANSRFAADIPGLVTRVLANPADTSIERDTDEVIE